MIITLEHPITVKLFNKSRQINQVEWLQDISSDGLKKKVTARISNTPLNNEEFVYAEVLILWFGEKAIDAPTPDPLAGSYFADADTSATGIENRIKEILKLRT